RWRPVVALLAGLVAWALLRLGVADIDQAGEGTAVAAGELGAGRGFDTRNHDRREYASRNGARGHGRPAEPTELAYAGEESGGRRARGDCVVGSGPVRLCRFLRLRSFGFDRREPSVLALVQTGGTDLRGERGVVGHRFGALKRTQVELADHGTQRAHDTHTDDGAVHTQPRRQKRAGDRSQG